MEKLFTIIPFTVAIAILVMAFGAKADSENPIFGNDIDASFVADLAASGTSAAVDPDASRTGAETEHQPDSSTSNREASHILRLPDIIVRPDPVEPQLEKVPEAKARTGDKTSSPLAALAVIDGGNRS